MQKNNSWGQPQHAKQPPIPFKTNASSAEVIPKGQKFITTQKAKLAEIQKHHIAVLPVLQLLDADRKAMESECQKMSKESERIMEVINKSEQQEVSNFANLVAPADEMSERVLNYVASIKAREDAIHLVESKFNEESISFEDFLKHIRRL
jgi:Na+/phosphate symporter